MPNTPSRKRRNRRTGAGQSKLPEWTKRLNASQRSCLTKFTRTGEVDMRNKVTEQRPMRKAAWERSKQQQQEAA